MINYGSISQILRIGLYTVAGYFLGEGVADGDMVQNAIGGVIAVGAFIWWLAFERDRQESVG